MEIAFGWGAGGTRTWDVRNRRCTVFGPQQLLALLGIGLGLTRPLGGLPGRIAQFRAVMEQASGGWYRESSAKDPWNTARFVLVLRDAAISAGWSGLYSSPSRLATLSAIESLVTVGAARDPHATLAPGSSDDLRETLAYLRTFASSPDASGDWPLGIDSIDILDDFDDLPHEWQELFTLLERCGVTISTRGPEQHDNVPASLTIVRGQDEWSTAESAARFLASAPDHESVVIIASDGTEVLDHHLHRRGLPTIGQPSAGTTDPASQLLPLFLSAIIPPLDVHRIAEFLSFRATTRAHPHPASNDDHLRSSGIIPFAARTAFLNALVTEPGISSDSDSAWMRALNDLERAAKDPGDPSATTAWALAQSLDAFLRTAPPHVADEHVTTDRVIVAVEWLAQRLRVLGGADPSRFITLASGHIASFLDTIRIIGSDRLLIRELFDIVDACAPASTTSAHPAQAAPWTVVTDPAHVPPGTDTVLWWSSHSTDSPQYPLWDDDEINVLESQGAHITPPAQYERLIQAAALRGLSHAKNLLAFCPDTVSGAEKRLHPALVQTAERFAQSRPDLFGRTPPPVDAVLTHPAVAHPVASQVTGGTWRLGDNHLGVRAVPPETLSPPARISRTLTGDFTHLLPTHLSYSQIDRLLNDPLSWTLSRGLRLTTGYSVQVPTANRMIGTLVHAVVEHLVRDGAVANGAIPTPDTIRTTFDRFVPRFASELLLPGQRTRLNALRTTAVGTLTHLFTALQTRGIQVTDAEASFTTPLTLTVAGRHHVVELKGFRDLDGQFPDGRAAVLDLKWTRSPKYFRQTIADGEAVQLSVYGQVLGASGAGEPPLTAYYMLKQGVFVTADRDLDVESTAEADPAHLWPRIQRSVEHALTRIATGHFDALAADAYLDTGTPLGGERKPYNDAITAIRAAAADDGRLFIATNQAFSDFTLIYGLTGDYS